MTEEHKKGNIIRDVFDGQILQRKEVIGFMPFLIFLAFLGFIYIGNRYNAEKVMKRNVVLAKEVKELKAEQMTILFKLMDLSRQSNLLKHVDEQGLGLQEIDKPPIKIIKR